MKPISNFPKFFQLFLDILSYILEKVATLIFAIGLFLTAPFLLLGSIPFLFGRHVLNKLGRRIKPSLGAMVTARGSVFAIDTLYNRKKPLITLVVQSQLKERIELSRVRNILETRVLPATEANGSLKFPELRQFITIWAGFFFWEWDPTFNLDNHLKYHRIESQHDAKGKEEALTKFHENLLQRPWPKNKPLWEIHVVDVDETLESSSEDNHNELDPKMAIKTTSTLYLRTSHSLVDGYSLLYLVSEYFSESGISPDHAKPVPPYRPAWETALFFATFPFRAALESCSVLALRINPFTILPLTVPWSSQGVSPPIFLSTKAVSVSKIKSIKDHFHVSFTSVLNSALTGGLRELMLSKGISDPPSSFPVLIPLPLGGHPGAGLRNYLGGALSYLPTRVKNPLSRLRACDRDVLRLKRSTFPVLSFIGVKLVGCAPAWILRLVCRNWFSSTYLTNFPGGMTPLDIGGVEVSVLKAGLGLFVGPTGVGFTAVSYQDNLWISVTGDGSLFSREELKRLVRDCERQMDLLVEKMEETV